MIVNQKELAQSLGISTRQVRNLKTEGLFHTVENQRGYVLEKCVQEYINFKINAEVSRRTNASKEEVQAEHEEVKKQISILKLRKLRRELHEAADVEAFLTNMLLGFKNRLLALPSKMAIELAGKTNANDVTRILQKNLLQTLDELTEYDQDEIDGRMTGEIDDFDDDEGEDD